MDTALLITIFSVASAVIGVFISWLVFARQKKKDTEKEGENRGVMASDIGYIKAGVDDLKRETRETRHDMGELSTRVARCEESCRQAHKRIDEIHEHITHN